MELDKQAAERIVEALAPALETELDRVSREAYQRAEAEFEEMRASIRNQAVEELQARFNDELQSAQSQWSAERAQLREQIDEYRALAEAPRALSGCSSQAEILLRFLNLASPFAASVAIYVSKAENLALWKSRGPASFSETIAQTGADAQFYFRPVAIREKIVAAVCAAEPCKRDTLDILGECLERSIEVFGLRLHTTHVQKANLA
jgi:hypothetical protein